MGPNCVESMGKIFYSLHLNLTFNFSSSGSEIKDQGC